MNLVVSPAIVCAWPMLAKEHSIGHQFSHLCCFFFTQYIRFLVYCCVVSPAIYLWRLPVWKCGWTGIFFCSFQGERTGKYALMYIRNGSEGEMERIHTGRCHIYCINWGGKVFYPCFAVMTKPLQIDLSDTHFVCAFGNQKRSFDGKIPWCFDALYLFPCIGVKPPSTSVSSP